MWLKNLFSKSYVSWEEYQVILKNREIWNSINCNAKKSVKELMEGAK